ncbi:hypothetical protein C3920_11405 [Novacetimonas pomaceti]|uniref:Uncharacterized protein n=2 Tax=Novacetimonas pomaceti TaxID=2021998 RepID=A0ABX5P041_9PROT|nr:hypothetical protein C3920_11405 [Novacetimonas pomaceti]
MLPPGGDARASRPSATWGIVLRAVAGAVRALRRMAGRARGASPVAWPRGGGGMAEVLPHHPAPPSRPLPAPSSVSPDLPPAGRDGAASRTHGAARSGASRRDMGDGMAGDGTAPRGHVPPGRGASPVAVAAGALWSRRPWSRRPRPRNAHPCNAHPRNAHPRNAHSGADASRVPMDGGGDARHAVTSPGTSSPGDMAALPDPVRAGRDARAMVADGVVPDGIAPVTAVPSAPSRRGRDVEVPVAAARGKGDAHAAPIVAGREESPSSAPLGEGASGPMSDVASDAVSDAVSRPVPRHGAHRASPVMAGPVAFGGSGPDRPASSQSRPLSQPLSQSQSRPVASPAPSGGGPVAARGPAGGGSMPSVPRPARRGLRGVLYPMVRQAATPGRDVASAGDDGLSRDASAPWQGRAIVLADRSVLLPLQAQYAMVEQAGGPAPMREGPVPPMPPPSSPAASAMPARVPAARAAPATWSRSLPAMANAGHY